MSHGLDTVLIVAVIASGGYAVKGFFGSGEPSDMAPPPPVAAAAPAVEPGAVLAPFDVIRSSGDREPLAFGNDARPSVYLVFRTDCPYCEATAPLWARIADESRLKIVAITVEGEETARRWLDRHEIWPDEIIVPADIAAFVQSWSIRGVPTTYVLDGEGVVEYSKYGQMHEIHLAALLDQFPPQVP